MSYTVRDGDDRPRIVISIPLDDELYCDEDTTFKILHVLVRAGLTVGEALEAIRVMEEDNGILFRERKH